MNRHLLYFIIENKSHKSLEYFTEIETGNIRASKFNYSLRQGSSLLWFNSFIEIYE